MPIIFISNVITLTNDAQALFKGQAGLNIIELNVKARTHGLTLLSNNENNDGYRIVQGGNLDVITKDNYDSHDLNYLYWKNTVPGSNCVVEVYGKRRV